MNGFTHVPAVPRLIVYGELTVPAGEISLAVIEAALQTWHGATSVPVQSDTWEAESGAETASRIAARSAALENQAFISLIILEVQ
jgi:hypothetical protein